jgi:hypothetical protein
MKVVPCFVMEFYRTVGHYFVIIFTKLLLCVRLVVMVNTCNSHVRIVYHVLHAVKLQRTPLLL